MKIKLINSRKILTDEMLKTFGNGVHNIGCTESTVGLKQLLMDYSKDETIDNVMIILGTYDPTFGDILEFVYTAEDTDKFIVFIDETGLDPLEEDDFDEVSDLLSKKVNVIQVNDKEALQQFILGYIEQNCVLPESA